MIARWIYQSTSRRRTNGTTSTYRRCASRGDGVNRARSPTRLSPDRRCPRNARRGWSPLARGVLEANRARRYLRPQWGRYLVWPTSDTPVNRNLTAMSTSPLLEDCIRRRRAAGLSQSWELPPGTAYFQLRTVHERLSSPIVAHLPDPVVQLAGVEVVGEQLTELQRRECLIGLLPVLFCSSVAAQFEVIERGGL